MKNFLKIFGLLAWVFIMISCENEHKGLPIGKWRVTMDLSKSKELPFLMESRADGTLLFFNAEEEIEITGVELMGDSIHISHPVFEGVFKGVYAEGIISGDFIKPNFDRIVPFQMTHGEAERFKVSEPARQSIDGNWEVVFSPDVEEDRYIAKGIFQQHGHLVTGTFRTTTGDYRYLEGVVGGDTLRLSTFDGSHVFLFEAVLNEDEMTGVFYSGNHFSEPFVGKRNATYELPSADSLTFLKEGYDKMAFAFADIHGDTISLEDDRFKNKVVVIQLMGTWCPNCLDETKYYTSFYKNKRKENTEFVAIAFEYAKTKEKAIQGITKLIDAQKVPYPILLAQIGGSNKVKANEKLPMLNHVLSYPTTIFIDKKGAVRKIHTGFNGPATGLMYTEFIAEFEAFVDQLSNE